MFWLSRITEHSTYAGGLLGPMMVTAAGLGMLFMPITLVALSKVEDRDAGLASSLLNTGQQVGGAIGLAILGTVAWTVVSNTARSQVTAAAAAAAKTGHAIHATGGQIPRAIYDHALAAGFSRGFLVSAGIAVIALVITLVGIRVKKEDLAGDPMALAAGATAGPRTTSTTWSRPRPDPHQHHRIGARAHPAPGLRHIQRADPRQPRGQPSPPASTPGQPSPPASTPGQPSPPASRATAR